MSLIKFFQAIDKTFLGKVVDRKLALIEKTDPDRIYVENIRSFYNMPYGVAKFFCERAVGDNLFKKKFGVECPNNDDGRLIATYDNRNQIPHEIKCDICEIREKDIFVFTVKPNMIKEFYQLNDQ